MNPGSSGHLIRNLSASIPNFQPKWNQRRSRQRLESLPDAIGQFDHRLGEGFYGIVEGQTENSAILEPEPPGVD